MADLKTVKAQVEANTGKLTEIKDDLTRVNTQLAAKIQELKDKVPDIALVDEIAALVGVQSTSLDAIAAIVPPEIVVPTSPVSTMPPTLASGEPTSSE